MPLDTSTESGPKIFGTGTLTAGLLAALISGSIVLYGRIYIPENSTQTTIIQRGTGSILTNWDSVSGTTCTNTGGLTKYPGCYGLNPGTGTQAILSLAVEAAGWPIAATQVSCFTSRDNAGTGQLIFTYKKPIQVLSPTAQLNGSGGTITASGGRIPLVPPSNYVHCWFDRAPGPGIKAKLRILSRDFYIP